MRGGASAALGGITAELRGCFVFFVGQSSSLLRLHPVILIT